MARPATAKNGAARRGQLRKRVIASLEEQGFSIASNGTLTPETIEDKAAIRALHATARDVAVSRARKGLERHQPKLLACFADGKEVVPSEIKPSLQLIKRDSEEELLFRYARLTWSIPVSAGYGRRIRFLVWDQHTGKLMGVIGLGDPVFAIRPRDEWVGWDREAKRLRLRHVMDAFMLGAVPPYSSLLCGKYIAMLLVSDEVRRAFKAKYRGSGGLISGKEFDGTLALVTTSSALGKSSVYNRIRLDGQPVLRSVGYTSGSGEFHFANGLYTDLLAYAEENLEPSAKHDQWGGGWRNRREVVRRTLRDLGLHPDMLYHGIKREVFVAPVATNTRRFLTGVNSSLRYRRRRASDLFDAFRERWLLPRAERNASFRQQRARDLQVWGASDE
jgi:hypothetical protein